MVLTVSFVLSPVTGLFCHRRLTDNRDSKDAAIFGNRIDALVRSCQDGQTIGIPVGPDTSRVISELMLCAVEAEMPRKLRDRIASGFRYIDDFLLRLYF